MTQPSQEVPALDQVCKASGGTRVGPMTRAGTAGVAVQGGYIVEQETNSDLRDRKKFQTYDQLLANVEICGASVRLLLGMIGKAKWTVEPAEDGGARADDIAETVDEIINDMERPWPSVVKRSAMYMLKGYSWQEWIGKKRDDGQIGFFDIESRSQATISRWDVDEDGIVFGVWQESPQTYKELYLPRSKAIYAVDDTFTDSPAGLGIMRHVAPAALRLQVYEQLEGVAFESDLRGTPVGRAPYTHLAALVTNKTLTQTQADAILENIQGFIKDHRVNKARGLVLDSMMYKSKGEEASPSSVPMWGMDLLKNGSTSQEAVARAIDRLNRGIARLTGTEFLLLGEGGGSLAMSKSKNNMFGLLVDSAGVVLSKVYDKDVIGTLGQLNGWPKELLPKFVPEKLQHRDVTEISDVLESLSRSGAPLDPDDEAVNVTRELIGMPKRETINLEVDAGLRKPKPTPKPGEEGEGVKPQSSSDANEESPNDIE